MNRYKLTAQYGGETRALNFVDDNDIEAMYSAIFRTLNKATQSVIWQKGKITLSNSVTGDIIKEMPAKQIPSVEMLILKMENGK